MPSSDHPHPPHQAIVLEKWRLLTIFWIVQSVVLLGVGVIWQLMAESVDGPKGVYVGEVSFGRIANVFGESRYWLYAGATLIGMTIGQALLVWPVARPRARKDRGWPVWVSLGVAGIGVAVMGAALLLATSSLFDLTDVKPAWESIDIAFHWIMIAWCLICWGIATPLLWRFSVRRLDAGARHEDVLSMISARLFTGTVIEVAAIIPLDIMIRRKETCYCWAGSFFALSLCGGMGLILLGPMILFPLLARRRKRYYAGICDACGYDMTALLTAARTIDRCPECGCGWRPAPDPKS